MIDDVQKLQKAKVDLDIAKTIALSAKSNLKRRTILLRSARRRNAPEEVKMVNVYMLHWSLLLITFLYSLATRFEKVLPCGKLMLVDHPCSLMEKIFWRYWMLKMT